MKEYKWTIETSEERIVAKIESELQNNKWVYRIGLTEDLEYEVVAMLVMLRDIRSFVASGRSNHHPR
jgi:hypothetical protein